MTIWIQALLFAFTTFGVARSYADLPHHYFERIKQKHPPKRASQILSKRLTLEIKNQPMNGEMVFFTLLNIKQLDATLYPAELTKVARELQLTPLKSTATSAQIKNLFYLVSEVSTKISIEDGFLLLENATPNLIHVEISQFFPLILSQMRPDLFMKYFETRSTIINEPSEYYKPLIEFYCLSAVISGKMAKCLEKLSTFKGEQTPSWIREQEFIARINSLDFEGATKVSKTLGPHCPSENPPWTNFQMARFHRLQNDIEKSLNCLESFRIAINGNAESLFFYNIEYAKTIRFNDLKKSETYIGYADEFVKEKNDSSSLYTLVLDLEKVKNSVLKEDSEGTKIHLERMGNAYQARELKPYIELITWLQAFSKNPQKTPLEKVNSYEIYDFSTILNKVRATNKK
ncbi:hypothetical protein K2X05_05560 [bacterium]|nr:hypothetical protein [bacterium]